MWDDGDGAPNPNPDPNPNPNPDPNPNPNPDPNPNAFADMFKGLTEQQASRLLELAKQEPPGGGADPDKVDVAALELPEGFELSEDASKGFQSVVDELKLTKDGAAQILKLHTDAVSAMQEGQKEHFASLKEGWRKASLEDAEIGGDKLEATTRDALAALEKFGTPELRKVLDETGLSVHPEMVRVFGKVGALLRDDNFVAGKDGQPRKSNFEVLFGGTT